MYRLSLLLTLLVVSFEGKGQEIERRLYIGLDVFKNIPPLVDKQGYFSSSLIIEPIVRVELAERLFLNIQAGYSRIGKDAIYNNLTHYRNEGVYLKSGVLYALIDEDAPKSRLFGISMGVSFTFTHFQESGVARLEGAFFGDLNKTYSNKNLNVAGVEIPLNFQLRLASRWKLNFQPRINILFKLREKDNLDFPVYYTPGAGSNYHTENDQIRIPTTNTTGGFTIQLFYRLL